MPKDQHKKERERCASHGRPAPAPDLTTQEIRRRLDAGATFAAGLITNAGKGSTPAPTAKGIPPVRQPVRLITGSRTIQPKISDQRAGFKRRRERIIEQTKLSQQKAAEVQVVDTLPPSEAEKPNMRPYEVPIATGIRVRRHKSAAMAARKHRKRKSNQAI